MKQLDLKKQFLDTLRFWRRAMVPITIIALIWASLEAGALEGLTYIWP